MSAALEHRDGCECCVDEFPRPHVANRPGLPSLHYRIGSHALFLRRMLRALPRTPLARLTARTTDDAAIAILDAWATTADVLTFYQERIANEGYLRTATERRSVLELARTIGYELNPGVAASTYLAFRVDDRPPPPELGPPIRQAIVAKGTRVQSIPGQNELPQTFETSSEIVARPEWNALRPRLTRPQPIGLTSTEIYVTGVATGVAPGDRILITAPRSGNDPDNPPPGADTSVSEVKAVTVEVALNRTRLDLEPVPKLPPKSNPPAVTPPPPAARPVFVAQDPPEVPPLKPPDLKKPTYVLQKRALTQVEIDARIVQFLWEEAQLAAQMAFLWWNPWEVDRYIHRRHFLNLDPVDELVEVPPPPDTTKPRVVSHFPGTGATKVHGGTKVTATFSEAMRLGTVTSAFTLKKLGATGPVAAVPTYNPATATATLIPELRRDAAGNPLKDSSGKQLEALESGATYVATVTTAARDVAGQGAGNELAAQHSWTFTVADTTPPTVTPEDPDDGETGVDVGVNVTATFSEPMKATTVDADAFELHDSTGNIVPATVTYKPPAGSTKPTATLVPAEPLAPSTHYTVLVAKMTDLANVEVGARVWSFTTAARDDVPPPGELAVHAFRERAGFFGAAAPKWGGLPKPDYVTANPYPKDWDTPARLDAAGKIDYTKNPGTPRTVWVSSQGASFGGDKVHLDRPVPGLVKDSWTIFESAEGVSPYWVSEVSERSLADYGLSGRATVLTLSQKHGESPSLGIGNPLDFKVRTTTAHVRSERLPLAELPVDDAVKAGSTELMLDRFVLGLAVGQKVILTGDREDLPGVPGVEILVLKAIIHGGGFTTLYFNEKLAHPYVRSTVTVNANVVAATHGETVAHEVLGGGDGTQPNQRFTLKKPPLTHVSASTPSGAVSTLELRVNDVLWEEVPRLYELGPRDEQYILRMDDDGKSSVIFGDGERGARPPTGAENVDATYRSGIGRNGMMAAGKLTLLQTRPLGIQSVTNPVPATDAADPQSRDDAKRTAPLTILTMDRIVSLRDYEDFARAFAAIGKARAAVLRHLDDELVHLTVSGVDGGEVVNPLLKNLVDAINTAREPGPPPFVESYQPLYFNVAAQVLVDPRHVAEHVLAAVAAAVKEAFSFERREFAHPVTAAEVVTVIQGVPGVVMVDLDKLYLFHEEAPDDTPPNPLAQILRARAARFDPSGESGTAPAELLLVNPLGLVVEQRTT